MPSLDEIRQQYPQYEDMSDSDFADAIYKKFYRDMPYEQFREKVGMNEPVQSGTILPISKTADGSVRFDSDAGLLGVAKRALTYPGEVMRGEVDPMSDEGIARNLEFATVASPMNPAMRAGDRIIPGALTRMQKNVKPPSMEALKKTGSAGFEEMKTLGVDYSPKAVQNLAIKIQSELAQEGFTPSNAKSTYAELKRLIRVPKVGAGERVTVPLQNLNAARSTFGNIAAGRAEGADGAAAELVKRRISQFIEGDGASAALAGPAARAAQVSREARGNYAAAKRSAEVQGVDVKAARQAAAANSGQNSGNAIRQRLTTFLNNPKATRGFSKQELDAIEKIVDGTKTQNGLRWLGNLLGGGGGLGGLISGGAGAIPGIAASNPMLAVTGAAAATATGYGSKAYYNHLIRKALQAADEAVRSRSPLNQEMLRRAPFEAIRPGVRSLPVRGLLATTQSGGGGY
jgi:hypothetical protein